MESILEQRLRTGAFSSLLHAVKSHAWGRVWRVVQCSFYSPFALPYPFSSFLCPDLNPFRFHHPSSLTICLPVGFGQRKVPGRDLRAGGERDLSIYSCWHPPTELQIGSGWVLLEPWLLLSGSFQQLQVSLGSYNFAFPLAPSGLSTIVASHPY